MPEKGDQQLGLRGEGKLFVIPIKAENLAEATHKAIIACHDYGARVETPKQKPGMTLGYDADMIIEVTNGIHNHWKKCKEHPEWWGYTYNERVVDQFPFVFDRIKADWDEKKGQWANGQGRPSGRDYQFSTWRPGEDIILEQEDPPCWQRGQIRLLQNEEGELVMNYLTEWRSRDLLKAWNQNNIGQVELMKLFAAKISDILDTPVKLGSYIDRSSSLHLYGLYIDRDGLEQKVEQMKRDGYESKSVGLEEYYMMAEGKDATGLKRLISAQNVAEYLGLGLNQSEDELAKIGINVDKFYYPKEWDTWPKSWDAESDYSMLARVPGVSEKSVFEEKTE
jgi:hypothetical protein